MGAATRISTMTRSAMVHSWMPGDDDAVAAAAGCIELRGVPREGFRQFGGEALEGFRRRETDLRVDGEGQQPCALFARAAAHPRHVADDRSGRVDQVFR